MRRSKIKNFAHLVWAVKHREKRLTPELERQVHRCITDLAEGMGCVVKAIGGMEDHVHVLLWMPATLAPADVIKKIKGVSSAMVNDLQNHEHYFRWQEHYALYSVSIWNVPKVTAYILNQKQRHADNTVIAMLEEVDEDAPEPSKETG